MTINNRYVSHSNVWVNEKDVIVQSIVDIADSKGLVKTYEDKRKLYDVIDDELDKFTMYRCRDYEKTGVVKWRIAYALLVVFQWVFWPICFVRWLRTGNFRLNSKSKIGMFIDRIAENSR